VSLVRRVGLGVRLGVAFGLLGLALLVVGVTSTTTLSKLDISGTGTAQGKDVKALEIVSVLTQDTSTSATDVVRHLYVYDGDLKTQDAIAKAYATRTAGSERAARQLAPLMHSAALRAAYARLNKVGAVFAARTSRALALSRKETLANAEDRDGSRGLYTEQIAPVVPQLLTALSRLNAAVRDDSHQQSAHASATAHSGKQLVLAILIVALLAAVALTFVITRSVTVPVKRLLERLRQVAGEDLASLEHGLAAFATGDLTAVAEATAEPLRDGGGDEIGAASAGVDELVERTRSSVTAYNDSRERLGGMIGGVGTQAERVGEASSRIAGSSEESGRAVGEIASAVGEIAAGAERQVQMVTSAASGAEQVRAAIEESARLSAETTEAAERARGLARDGVAHAARATEAMEQVTTTSRDAAGTIQDLAQRSEAIGEIVASITQIAEQTNLLALNAAIEAARAGEHGRGFAVVAEEVRKLAEDARGSATEISGLIGEIQEQTARAVTAVQSGAQRSEDGSATVAQAQEAFTGIDAAVDEVGRRIAQIAEVAERVSQGATQMTTDVSDVAAVTEEASASAEQVSASTQQTAASSQEVASGAQDLARTAAELRELVGAFRVA
jgi:methyl-accepting chemotaxis protein